MSEAFAQMGHGVIICTDTPLPDNLRDFDEHYEKATKIKILRYPSPEAVLKSLTSIIKELSVDIVMVHGFAMWRKCTAMLPLVPVPIVSECHCLNESANCLTAAARTICYKTFIKKRTKALFTLSENTKQIFINRYGFQPELITVTPNGREVRMSSNSFLFGNKETFVFGYAGTLFDWQGIPNILAVAESILAISDDVRIELVGGGPLYQEVKRFISHHSLETRIYVTDYLSQVEYDKYIDEKFDVFMIPRPSTLTTETAIPLKIFDAINHKKPIVMSDVSGLTDVLDNEQALIYSASDLNEFVNCCRKIYRNAPLAESLVSAASKRLSRWPAVGEVARRQLDVMENLIAANQDARK
jgi:glycosyltransferase involved in cell wall biosynthesis